MAAITTPARRALHADRINEILVYWFGSVTEPKQNFSLWFEGSPAIDAEITSKFKLDVEKAQRGDYLSWLSEPHAALALCITLDQFSLNIYRDKPEGYMGSASAIPLEYTAIGRGFDQQVNPIMRSFFYLPLMHSEHEADQKKCVQLYPPGDEFAAMHHDVVVKYGRFPGRNTVMGRAATAAEEAYLAQGGVF